MSTILDQQLISIRSQIDEIVKDLHGLTLEIRNDELAQTVSDLRNRINEPFMFVIVGEVKAGKSSFINALLATGKEIAKVGPMPITDTVQQITYGEQEEVTVINPYLKKVTLPVEILREIAIVDTPGTNTIIQQHQEITERFIPASDLIVFVFEAKNPYRQSAWDFFDFIHSDWRKKIIFVLQQKDLLPAEDLAVNERGVQEYALKKGIAEPHIFSVSAKLEQEGDLEGGGFAAIRTYIRNNITGGKAPILKLHNNLEISRNINGRILDGLDLRRKQLVADVAFRKDVNDTLEHQSQQSHRKATALVENLIEGYDRITLAKETELSNGLSFLGLLRRSLAGLFTKQASAKEWLEGLAASLGTELELELQRKLQDGVGDLAESIQQMAKIIDLKIQQSKTILRNNHAVFSDIAERRSNVLKDLQDAFRQFLNSSESFSAQGLFPSKGPIASNVVTGSGIAVVGAILTAVTNLAVLDITGGILTAVGFIFAGVSTTVHRRRIIQNFRSEISKGRDRMEKEVTEKLDTYIQQIAERIDANFDEFDALIEQEKTQIDKMAASHQHIEERLQTLDAQLEKI